MIQSAAVQFGAAKVTRRNRVTNPWDNKTAPDSDRLVAFADKLLARPEVKRAIEAADKRITLQVFEQNRPTIKITRKGRPFTRLNMMDGSWYLLSRVALQEPGYFLKTYGLGIAQKLHQLTSELLAEDLARQTAKPSKGDQPKASRR